MTAAKIESPCISVCAVDGETSLCVGCGRSLPEIGNWTRFSATERRAIMDALPQRLVDLRASGKLKEPS